MARDGQYGRPQPLAILDLKVDGHVGHLLQQGRVEGGGAANIEERGHGADGFRSSIGLIEVAGVVLRSAAEGNMAHRKPGGRGRKYISYRNTNDMLVYMRLIHSTDDRLLLIMRPMHSQGGRLMALGNSRFQLTSWHLGLGQITFGGCWKSLG